MTRWEDIGSCLPYISCCENPNQSRCWSRCSLISKDPKIQKSRSDKSAHAAASLLWLQLFAGYKRFCVFFLFLLPKNNSGWIQIGVCQIDRREFRFQISAVQLASKVKTYIKNIYSKTQMNPLKNHSSSWRGTSEPRQSHVGATCWWGWTLWQRFDCTTQSRPSEMLRGSKMPALILNERKMY